MIRMIRFDDILPAEYNTGFFTCDKKQSSCENNENSARKKHTTPK